MEQRGENVASYCETSLLHEYKLDGLALKAVSGKEPDVTVAPCGGGWARAWDRSWEPKVLHPYLGIFVQSA